MKASKQKELEAHGWRVGDAQDFLSLSDEEMAYLEMKILVAEKLKDLRCSKKMSQTELARLLGSSQSRVAKMERGDPSVSIDLLLKGLLVLGASRKQIAKTIGSKTRSAA